MSNLKGLGDAAKLAVQLIDVISHASGNDKPDKKLPEKVEVVARKVSEPKCRTCADTLKVGVPGHEVACPKCVVEQPPCATCKGREKVGAKGHEVPCPVCQRGSGE